MLWKQWTVRQRNEEESLAQTFPSRLLNLISSWTERESNMFYFRQSDFLCRSVLIIFSRSQRKVERFGVKEECFRNLLLLLFLFSFSLYPRCSSSCPSALLLSSCPLSFHINRSCAAHVSLTPFRLGLQWSCSLICHLCVLRFGKV